MAEPAKATLGLSAFASVNAGWKLREKPGRRSGRPRFVGLAAGAR